MVLWGLGKKFVFKVVALALARCIICSKSFSIRNGGISNFEILTFLNNPTGLDRFTLKVYVTIAFNVIGSFVNILLLLFIYFYFGH